MLQPLVSMPEVRDWELGGKQLENVGCLFFSIWTCLYFGDIRLMEKNMKTFRMPEKVLILG